MKNFIFLVVFLLSGTAQADWTASWGKITDVMSHDGKHIVYTTITDKTCAGTGRFWWPADDTDAKDMLALSLAAFMGDKNVRFVHETQNEDCVYGGINKATHIQIKR
ncbi:hypothetical protein ACU6U9_01425 [Pseudomonas sp. HK3]